MNNKSEFIIYSFVALLMILLIGSSYLYTTNRVTTSMLEKKIAFVKLTGLPDLAISTQDAYVRHRSMSTIFSIYRDDGSLREYSPFTFVYSHSHIKSLYE